MTSFLYRTIDTWLKIQRTGKLGALLCPEHHFPFTQSREGPYLQPYQRASRLVSRRGPLSGLPQLPHSPPPAWEELLLGWYRWAPHCHTGAGTPGSTPCLPDMGTHFAFQLPSPDHVPASAHHKPTSAYHLSNENRQNSQTTTQTQVIHAGQNGIVPSVKPACFLSDSIFSLLLHGGEGRGGDHRTRCGCRYFSRSGSSSQLPCLF